MIGRRGKGLGRSGWRIGASVLLLALLGLYWLLPISGQVALTLADRPSGQTPLWPRFELVSPAEGPGEMLTFRVTDDQPWAHVLLTVNGEPTRLERSWSGASSTWTWEWTYTPKLSKEAPGLDGARLVFYHDCETGCVERGRAAVGQPADAAPGGSEALLPTKLGVVFANPERDWHGRQGWVIELTYARLPRELHWGIDDLAARVYAARSKGLRVLVRVDYDRGQSLPPTGSYPALAEYLGYLRRLARDDRLREVSGYVVGSGFNALDANALSRDHPVTPAWYARLFNGSGEAVARTDNAVQVIRRENPEVKALVGPVRPWVADQNGEVRFRVDVPWLNYMHSLVAALDEGARAKAAAGVPLVGPDGFAIQAPGRPGAAGSVGESGAEEPRLSLRRAEWGDAEAGFRVYRDWLEIVNAYPMTRGLPVYITSTNTYAPDDGVPPAENYPTGWLTTALAVIDAEPQVMAICWYLDGPLGDRQWDSFSLGRGVGRVTEAARELDSLLRARP